MTPEQARQYAILLLVIQGASPEWAETHVGQASYDGETLSYGVTLDCPVRRLYGTFTLE